MSSVKAELKGMDELMKRLEEMGRKGASIENRALKTAGEDLVKVMKSEAPFKTGDLKESIGVSRIKSSKGRKRIEVGPTVYYAKFLEFGTSKMSAKPFMGKSYDSSKDRLRATMIAEIKRGLGI